MGQKSFPMRFHSMIIEEKLFDDQENGINACFVISAEQKGGIAEIFPMFPQERVIIAPNGINVDKFKPREKDLNTVAAGVETLGKTLAEAITTALNEDWKTSKGEACIKLAHDKFTVEAQVTNMLADVQKL